MKRIGIGAKTYRVLRRIGCARRPTKGVATLRFRINKERFQALCDLRGWRFPASDLARATGFTRSYCRQILEGTEEVTQQFMGRYLKVVYGNEIPENWSVQFVVDEDHRAGRRDFRHQRWNNPKYDKQVPYDNGSLQADFRRQDGEVEEQENGHDAK